MTDTGISWNNIRTRSAQFAARWADQEREQAGAQGFWVEFLAVFGLDARQLAEFERRVTGLEGGSGRGRIDMLIPGQLLAEHKSRGRDLNAALGAMRGRCKSDRHPAGAGAAQRGMTPQTARAALLAALLGLGLSSCKPAPATGSASTPASSASAAPAATPVPSGPPQVQGEIRLDKDGGAELVGTHGIGDAAEHALELYIERDSPDFETRVHPVSLSQSTPRLEGEGEAQVVRYALTLTKPPAELLTPLGVEPPLEDTGVCKTEERYVSDPDALQAKGHLGMRLHPGGIPEAQLDLLSPWGESVQEPGIVGNQAATVVKSTMYALRYVDRDTTVRLLRRCDNPQKVYRSERDELLELREGWNLIETRMEMKMLMDRTIAEDNEHVRVVPFSTPVQLLSPH